MIGTSTTSTYDVDGQLPEGARIVTAEDWATIAEAMAVLKGRLSQHVDADLLARIDAVTVTVLELDTCEHLTVREISEHDVECLDCGWVSA